MVMRMIPSPVCCFILLLCLSFVDAGRIFREMKERVRKEQLQRAEQLLLAKASSGGQRLHVTEDFMAQQLDHFNRLDKRTFLQRFFVNNRYWHGAGPVFLYIGGEGPLWGVDVLWGHHVKMAEQHGALVLALEHRFYGRSIRPDGLETRNLASLSSQQALVDLAVFHEHISRGFNLTSRHTWICFGGSYAGALSAWFKREFPHLVFAAVASSAPVKAQLDFSAYNDMVGLGLRNERVGGSLECFTQVRQAFAALEAALTSGNVSRVAADFHCCDVPTDRVDQVELIQSLADIFDGTVQYNEEGSFFSIRRICGVMTNKARDHERGGYERLIALSKIFFRENQCLDVSHHNMLKYLMDTTVTGGSNRQWIYQTCTEFGYYQGCEGATCPFSEMISFQSEMGLCPSVFGISQDSLPERIALTNTYYGGNDYTTQRVVFINGEVDPWSRLSILGPWTSNREKARTIFIAGAAHCADMMGEKDTDSDQLKAGRRAIEECVSDWLKEAEEEKERRAHSG